jgi:predicted enzyme related to lactoylglutathione lyase
MIPDLTIGNLMIDCTDPERARNFYAKLTNWEQTTAFGCSALKTENGLTILFAETDVSYVPPVWPEEPGKQQKQMHLDFTVDNLAYAVNEAVRLGASKATSQYGGESCITMIDTEGHPFCLCKRQSHSEFEKYFRGKGYDVIPNPSINIDCRKFELLRRFYEQLTDWDRDFHPTALIAENGMVIHFMECDFDYIPPVWPEEPAGQQKQMHFNFQVNDLQSAVEEAVSLGAVKPGRQYGGEHFMTLLDTEGHPFCLCAR